MVGFSLQFDLGFQINSPYSNDVMKISSENGFNSSLIKKQNVMGKKHHSQNIFQT